MITSDRIVELTKTAHKFREIFKESQAKGYKFFLKEWQGFNPLEKESIKQSFIDNLEYLMESHDAIIDPIRRTYCATMLNKIKDDLEGKPDYGTIKLKKGIKPVDIAFIF